jgi:LysR family glycine cleavage system transcriptional activator
MTGLPPPAWLRTFEAAARLGGFAAAGEELGLTPAAVSQQIRALEGRLGFDLFRRLPRGVALTEMGQAYLPPVRRAFEDLSDATAGLFGMGEAEPVLVRAPPSFAALCLAPRLSVFLDAHPDVPLRLSTSIWADAARETAVDVDIRYGDGRWPAVEAHRLTAPVSVLVAPPGAEGPVAAWLGRAIHVAGCESLWRALAAREGLPPGTIGTRLSADSSLVALEMVAAGLGASLVASYLAQPALASGRVSAPGAVRLQHDQAHYVLVTGSRPQARLFRDWLLATFADSGEGPGA